MNKTREKNMMSNIKKNLEDLSLFKEENNRVRVVGKIEQELTYSHEEKENTFYKSFVSVKRSSGIIDYIPIIMLKDKKNQLYIGQNIICDKKVEIYGNFRSRNVIDANGKMHLGLYLYVDDIKLLDFDDSIPEAHDIFLDGFICKPTKYKISPSQKKICEIMLAVNCENSKESYYIPCIAWDENAIRASFMEVGQRIHIYGCIQSREYYKRIDKATVERRTTYEISCVSVEKYEETQIQNDVKE